MIRLHGYFLDGKTIFLDLDSGDILEAEETFWEENPDDSLKHEYALNAREVAAFEEWSEYGWKDAWLHHALCRNYAFLDYKKVNDLREDLKIMEEYQSESPPPPPTKKVEGSTQTKHDLPPLYLDESLDYSEQKIMPTIDIVEGLMRLAVGSNKHMMLPGVGKSLLKTSPSGGARHPTEAHLINLDMEDISAGVYHFDVEEDRLKKTSIQVDRNSLQKIFYQGWHKDNMEPAAIIVLSSVVGRNMWRYREPRTFRVLFLDIGHIVQTICSGLDAANIEYIAGHGYEDSEAEKLLGLEWNKESIMYMIAICKKTNTHEALFEDQH